MSVSAALFYGVCSGSMAFINKLVVTTYDFHYPNFIMLSQMIFTAALLEVLRRRGMVNVPGYTLALGKDLLIPSVCYAFHSVFALTALSDINIPMYNVIKRCVPLVNLFIAPFILKKGPPSVAIVSSVSLITIGCVIAGMGDIEFNVYAYIYGGISVLSQALYLLYIQKTGIDKQISALGVLFINSINCIPLLLAHTLVTFELPKAIAFLQITDPMFIAVFLVVISMGCVLNYSLFLCTTLNSALTTSLVGVIKGVITTVIGMVTFGGVQPTVMIITGIVINTIGGVWYTWIKYQERLDNAGPVGVTKSEA
ncbi:uncharacterized protein LOC144452494 [Glandiceps talaboti]